MDRIAELKLYDRIISFVNEKTRGTSEMTGAAFKPLITQLKAAGINYEEFKTALKYLVDTGYIIEKYDNFKLAPKGREKLSISFEKEFIETEKDRTLQRENLEAVTGVARLEQRFIPKTMALSIISIVVSMAAIINSYVLFFLNDEKNISHNDCDCHCYSENDKDSLSRRILRAEKPIKKPLHDSTGNK